MDLIVGLPKVGVLGSIIVVVDRLSKYEIFILASKNCNVEMAAQLFVTNMKYWGVPQTIVSHWDPRFTYRFWTELFQLFRVDAQGIH